MFKVKCLDFRIDVRGLGIDMLNHFNKKDVIGYIDRAGNAYPNIGCLTIIM